MMESTPSTKPSADLSSLPPEVWICVFHHATHVPGTLIPEVYASAGLLGPVYSSTFYPRIREALVIKSTLVRVCRQWWHLAIPCLYQSVYINRVRCLTSLLRTLADSVQRKGTIVGTRPLGEYTQRLDVAIRDHSMDQRAELDSLATIINCMPHLTIISFSTTTRYDRDLPANVLHALSSIAPSLYVLDWALGQLEPTASQLMNLLTKCTRLRVLNCPRLIWYRDFDHGGIPPTLTTLRVHSIRFGDATHSDHQPIDLKRACHLEPSALQELVLSLDRDTHWADLLRAYSSQLISVHFYIPSFPPLDIEARMALLSETCPGLHHLTITSNYFSAFIRPNLEFPSITYLGLRATRIQMTRQDFKTLFLFLEELKSRVPSLRVVRLLNERNLHLLFNTHTKLAVGALEPFMDAVPFRVEDNDGMLLTDRLKVLGHL